MWSGLRERVKEVSITIFGPFGELFCCVLLAVCKHCWIYFCLTPLILYMFKVANK